MRSAVASMTEEQRNDALVFLECNTEELAVLPDGCEIQAVANVCNLLDYLTFRKSKNYRKLALQ